MPLVTGPADVSVAVSRDGRVRPAAGSATPSGPIAWLTARQAGRASSASGSAAMTAKPMASTATSACTPGSGSASRAAPIGISGEAATATATARIAPATVTRASRAADRASRLRRVMPNARRIGNSAESSASWRASSWPSTASEITPASAAKIARATASGRMPRSVAVISPDRLTKAVKLPSACG